MKDLTIIIPSYNTKNFILTALESIKLQKQLITYEVLIIDDGSKDETFDIVNNWIKQNRNDESFKLIRKENGNWGSVINYAKNNNLIKGRYVTILDADDYFFNNCFDELAKVINKDYDMIIGNFYRTRKDKLKKTHVMFGNKSKEFKKEQAHTGWSIPLCKFFKTSLFIQMENLREKVSYQDQILYHFFVNKFANRIYFISKFIGVYYENREGSSTTMNWDKNRINLWCNNMNKILSLNSHEASAYVKMMMRHCYSNADKNLKNIVVINKEYIDLFKKAKFKWIPPYLAWIAKIIFVLLTLPIVKNSKKIEK